MAAVFQNVALVNTYAPSGAEKRRKREHFFSHDLQYLLRDIPTSLLQRGDFNSVHADIDTTGRRTYSRALQELIRGYDLVDMWEASQTRDIHTQYTSRGASRIDRIYASRDLSGQKRGMETRFAAFTDHLAVVLRITLQVTTMRRGRGFWRMNMALLRDKGFQGQLRQQRATWNTQIKKYTTMMQWWESCKSAKKSDSS